MVTPCTVLVPDPRMPLLYGEQSRRSRSANDQLLLGSKTEFSWKLICHWNVEYMAIELLW
jgi:hypothetical protein